MIVMGTTLIEREQCRKRIAFGTARHAFAAVWPTWRETCLSRLSALSGKKFALRCPLQKFDLRCPLKNDSSCRVPPPPGTWLRRLARDGKHVAHQRVYDGKG